MPELSVVIPVYGCADCLRALHRRLHDTLGSIASSYEIVFVDDRSPDDAWETLRELAAADPAVKALRLSRNFGQHAAITAGLANSDGRFTAVMDCDLQDPPEDLARFTTNLVRQREELGIRRIANTPTPCSADGCIRQYTF